MGMTSQTNDLTPPGLEQGQEVLLQAESLKTGFRTTIIGSKPDAFLIVEAPAEARAGSRLALGVKVTVLYFKSGSVCAFETRVIGRTVEPAHLLFLAHPGRVEVRKLRRWERIDARLPAALDTGSGRSEGALLDISLTGCRISCPVTENSGATRLKVDDRLRISFNLLPAKEEAVFVGRVRNIETDGQVSIIGVQFDEPEAETSEGVRDYIRLMSRTVGEPSEE